MGMKVNGTLGILLPLLSLVACDSSTTALETSESTSASTAGALQGTEVVSPQGGTTEADGQTAQDDGTSSQDSADSENESSVASNTSDSNLTDGGHEPSASVSSQMSLDFSDLPESDLSVFVDSESNVCLEVGETTHLNISGIVFDVNSGFDVLDLTAHASLDLSEHPNVSIASHSDESISLSVNSQDIVDLTVYYENQFDRIFISALETSIVKPVILKKHYPESRCSFALYTSAGCAVLTSEAGTVGTSSGGISIEVDGCQLHNPSGTPVLTVE